MKIRPRRRSLIPSASVNKEIGKDSDIAAKQTETLERKRTREEVEKLCEAIEMKDDAEREKKRTKMEEEMPRRSSVPSPCVDKEREEDSNIAVKHAEVLELKRTRGLADQLCEEIKEKDDSENEMKRKKMEEDTQNAANPQAETQVETQLKLKLSRRKVTMKNAQRVMDWKRKMNYDPSAVFPSGEMRPEAQEMLESAKRGMEHDLCETCGETLRFCVHKKCCILGCTTCFGDGLTGDFTMCFSCNNVVCGEHFGIDFESCSTCDRFVCKACRGKTCIACKSFICSDCDECSFCGISPVNDRVQILKNLRLLFGSPGNRLR